ncbi:MAG: NAD(P)-binding protein [Legionellales bacterium]|nr:NAD(P)-binding protein [Legionellales bacterium]
MADAVIVGAGFTGLTVGLELSRMGKKVIIVESDATPGGLAGTFEFTDGVSVEKFYHHWFNNDKYVPKLASSLGLADQIITLPSRTGMYFNGQLWKLSTPLDLLKFSPLSLFERIKLGLMTFKVRRIKDWRAIESLSIREWLEPLCGENVFKTVWQPLIQAKFSIFAEQVSAVWMWKKLVLRGSTRNKTGGEELAYFKGGFGRLAQAMVDEIKHHGGEVYFNTKIKQAQVGDHMIKELQTETGETFSGKQFLFTPAFPIIADILNQTSDHQWLNSLRRVNYLGNICLVLQLKQSLSDTYWLNVNDPGFPFVGVIEHTNFDHPEHYNGYRIAFLSRYLAKEDPLWHYSDEQYLAFAIQHLQRMFPQLDPSWVNDFSVWRADYAQPVTERNYSTYVPNQKTPFTNGWISTMAQIYPEDRGTNYAIREGFLMAKQIGEQLC